ncbi:hypothetical protein [Spirosoma areae]
MKNLDKTFVVSLEGLELSDEQVKRIEHGIRSVVLNELAKIDNKGDLLLQKNFGEKLNLGGIIIDLPANGPVGLAVRPG